MTQLVVEFFNPILSDFEPIEEKYKPPVLKMAVSSSGQRWTVTLTDPMVIMSPPLSLRQIIETINTIQNWDHILVLKNTNDLVSYSLIFSTEEEFEFGIRADGFDQASVA